MSEEEMRRKMEFIVEQQAQFAVDIRQLRESQSELTQKHGLLTDALTTIVGVVGKLAERVEEIAEAQKQTDARLSRLAEAQAETNERLNIFINVVERYISERRNGRARDEGDGAPPPGGEAK